MSDKKFGKYTLMRHLATGGMAEIWLAEQRGPGGFNKELVIKRILPHLAEEGDIAQMFVDEARIVAYLTHPNIGQVFELGEQDGDYFIAMEFIDGLDLVDVRDKIAERGTEFPVVYAARIICDVLAALDYAHNFVDRQGNHVKLVHRDISPHNVLISNDGVVKLVDFGVAKAAINRHKTETGAVKGKFGYMAPEQIESQELDHRVDLFAVGVVFFELLTGERPFGDDLKAVSRILSEDAPDPRDFRADIPDPVADIILKALARNRDERYATAADMERAIELYLRTTDEVVGTRELSVMIHQLRGLTRQKPTEQLFGFEKQGVDKKEPRLTVKDGKGDRTAQLFGKGGQRKPGRETHQTAPATPSGLTNAAKNGRSTVQVKPQQSNTEQIGQGEDEAEPRGVSVGLVIGFLVMMFGLIAAFGVASYLFISGAEPAHAIAGPSQSGGAAAAETSRAVFRHAEDSLIVFLDADESADVYVDDEKVGELPYVTTLRSGNYTVELRGESGEREVRFTVEDHRAVQVFRL